jgi:hypothetical protein
VGLPLPPHTGPHVGPPSPPNGGNRPQAAVAYPADPNGPWCPDRGRNGFAIAGLVLGILPVMAGLLGIVFGLIGRTQAKRNGQKGRVMGTWGAVLGALWLTAVVVYVVNDLATEARRGSNGAVVKPGHESAFSLHVGDCLRSTPGDGAQVDQVDLVPCSRPHKGEVFGEVDLTDPRFPGREAVFAEAQRVCKRAFETFDGLAFDDSTLDVVVLNPTARSWSHGDRQVVCLITGDNLVGSMKGSRR